MMSSWLYTIRSTFPVHTWSLLSILLLGSSVNGKRMDGLFLAIMAGRWVVQRLSMAMVDCTVPCLLIDEALQSCVELGKRQRRERETGGGSVIYHQHQTSTGNLRSLISKHKEKYPGSEINHPARNTNQADNRSQVPVSSQHSVLNVQ